MTRADLTTWGKNILPSPNRSPTTFMPSISGPSITSIGRLKLCRAASVSSSTKASMPLISAYSMRLATGNSRHSRFSSFFSLLPSPLYFSAISSRRSVESSRRFSTTSSTHSRNSSGRSSYTASCPALTMPMSIPALIAWYKNTA